MTDRTHPHLDGEGPGPKDEAEVEEMLRQVATPPPDVYNVVLTGCRLLPNNQGEMQFAIASGPHKGRRAVHRFALDNVQILEEPTRGPASRLPVARIAAICAGVACEVLADLEGYHWKALRDAFVRELEAHVKGGSL